MYDYFRDYPSDYPCHVINRELWQQFLDIYRKTTGREAVSIWTEAEVVQWLDTNTTLKWRNENEYA